MLCMWIIVLVCIRQPGLPPLPTDRPHAPPGTTTQEVGHSDYRGDRAVTPFLGPLLLQPHLQSIRKGGLFPSLCVGFSLPVTSLLIVSPCWVPSPQASPEFTLPLQLWQMHTILNQFLQNQVPFVDHISVPLTLPLTSFKKPSSPHIHSVSPASPTCYIGPSTLSL